MVIIAVEEVEIKHYETLEWKRLFENLMKRIIT